MMDLFVKPLALLSLLSFFYCPPVGATGTVDAVIPRAYTATYRVFYNGKDVADVTVNLSHQGDLWTLKGHTHDMRGLAGVLNVHGTQESTGKWQDGRFLPEDYAFSFSLIGYSKSWRAKFDWPSGTVTTTGEDGATPMALKAGAADPLSLSLNLRALLSEKQSQFALNLVEEDGIENQLYRVDGTEAVNTRLGCIETTRVKRVRENSKRTSTIWYANKHDYVPVKLQHKKKKGNGFVLKIRSLEIDGQPLLRGRPCLVEGARLTLSD